MDHVPSIRVNKKKVKINTKTLADDRPGNNGPITGTRIHAEINVKIVITVFILVLISAYLCMALSAFESFISALFLSMGGGIVSTAKPM
jgi:hypothetical protein